jgi:hypothetical protein
MEPLFLTTKNEIDKEANIKLERDPKQWPENITMFLHQAYPWITDAKIQVNFNRIDAEDGTGVGQIQLDDKASIPIIIDNFKLQPLDVFWANGKLQPLTKNNLLEMLEGQQLGRSIEPKRSGDTDMALLSRTQVPYDGRYVYASTLGLSQDDIFAAARNAFSYDDLEVALGSNPTFRTVMSDWMKTATAKGLPKKARPLQPTGKVALAADKAVTANMGTPIKRDKSENVKAYPDVLTKEKDRHTLPHEAGAPKLEHPDLIEHETHHPGVIKKGGFFDLPMSMERVPCVVANHIVSMDGQVKEGSMAAFELDGDRYYYGSNFVGYRPKETVKLAAYGTNLVKGWGAFVFQTDNPMEVIATEPVKVLFRERTTEGFDKIAVETIGGRRNILVSGDVKDWTEIDGDLYISNRWTFKPCGQMEKVSGYMPVSPTGAAVLEKFAEWLKQSSTDDWTWARPKTKAVNLFKEASAVQPAVAWFPLSNVRGDKLVKVALSVNEEQAKKTVDTILGLNFVTPENSYKFADQLEKVSEAKEACAKLLLASRLGLPLQQAPLKTAMYALDAVELDLTQFRNVASGAEQQ